MTESTHGIILRTRPLTETSLIVHWLTPGLGRVATVAKGARRPRSPFAGKLDLFYAADFSFSRSRRSELHTLREVRLRQTHAALRENIGKLQQAAYLTNFIEQATEADTPLPKIYEMLEGFLDHLHARPATPPEIFALELNLLRKLGLEPDLAGSRLTPGTQRIVETLAGGGRAEPARLKLSTEQAEELRHWLHGYLIFQLGKLPRGRAAALGGAA
jgi:DNA repair protein RecO (recombination protein O)